MTIENVKCPDCGGEMVSRKGQYGVFWGCRSYPKCKGTRDSQGRSKAEREAWKEEQGNKKEEEKLPSEKRTGSSWNVK